MSNATDNATGGLYASNGCFYGEDGPGIAGTNLAVLIISAIGFVACFWIEVPFFRLKSKRAFPNNVLPHAYVLFSNPQRLSCDHYRHRLNINLTAFNPAAYANSLVYLIGVPILLLPSAALGYSKKALCLAQGLCGFQVYAMIWAICGISFGMTMCVMKEVFGRGRGRL